MAQVLRAFSKRLGPGALTQPSGSVKLNFNHPIARGLIGYFPVGNQQFNVVNGNPMIVTGGVSPSGTVPIPTSELYGPAMNFIGNAQLVGGHGGYTNNSPIIARSGGANWSIACLVKMSTVSVTAGAPLYGERSSNPGTVIIKLNYLNNDATQRMQVTLRNDAATLLQVAGSSGQADNQYHYWVGTKMPAGSSTITGTSLNVILYRDGVVQNTGAWTGADTYVDSGLRSGIGCSDIFDDGDQSLGGTIAYSAVWNRALTPDEVSFLYRNPFCLLRGEEMPALNTQSGSPTIPFLFSGWGSPASKNIPIGY